MRERQRAKTTLRFPIQEATLDVRCAAQMQERHLVPGHKVREKLNLCAIPTRQSTQLSDLWSKSTDLLVLLYNLAAGLSPLHLMIMCNYHPAAKQGEGLRCNRCLYIVSRCNGESGGGCNMHFFFYLRFCSLHRPTHTQKLAKRFCATTQPTTHS